MADIICNGTSVKIRSNKKSLFGKYIQNIRQRNIQFDDAFKTRLKIQLRFSVDTVWKVRNEYEKNTETKNTSEEMD